MRIEIELRRGRLMEPVDANEVVIARMGDTSVLARHVLGSSAETRRGNSVHPQASREEIRVVVQKGRSFQRANPHIPVLVDCGRYLVVELAPGAAVHAEPGCFTVAERLGIGFRTERAAPGPRREEVAALVGRISSSELRSRVEALAALPTRHSLMPRLEPALKLAEGWLRAAGCITHRIPVPIPGGETANLVAERHGTSDTPRLFMVCAHLDSVNHEEGPDGFAPGADDNASGSASVVAIAQTLADQRLAHDVRFLLFGGEEQGLLGSSAYVDRLSEADRRRLAGVVNIDMAASQNTPGLSVLLEGAEVSRGVIDEMARAAATYTQLETQVSLDPYASDHVPFIRRGLPAVLTIEGADSAYAHEHTARDTPDRLNYALHREITAMNLAWLAEQVL